MIKIAIDPGWSGAIVYDGNNPYDNFFVSVKCPDSQAGIINLVNSEFSSLPRTGVEIRCIIEAVHSMPTDGRKSLWSFATNYATWISAFLAFGIPYKLVTPLGWQKLIGVMPADRNARKKRLKEYAEGLYPKIKVTLANADALCIYSKHDEIWRII